MSEQKEKPIDLKFHDEFMRNFNQVVQDKLAQMIDKETPALEEANRRLEENPELINSEMWQQSWLWDEGLTVDDLQRYRKTLKEKKDNCPYWKEPS